MSIFSNIFARKSEALPVVVPQENKPTENVQASTPTPETVARYNELLCEIESYVRPRVVNANMMTLFMSLPEVYWPIDYVAKRISEAHFDLRRASDDSVVWCNRLGLDSILKSPNPINTWREMVYQHFVYRFATGNSFMRAAMPEHMGDDAIKAQWCSSFWELPADYVTVEAANAGRVPMFGIAAKDDIIKGYRLNMNEYATMLIPTGQVWHDRDGLPDCMNSYGFLKSKSRLTAAAKPIANLIAVYEARNVIYSKRGGLGFIVAKKEDATGTIALDPTEKDELRAVLDNRYGLTEGRSPWGVTDVPVEFVRTNLSIADLQPFDETLEDAVKIASLFNIPAVLVPRKDQATFSNQNSAEKTVYTATIIPTAKRFCEELTIFLGLDKKGYYIDCNFDDVDCLQSGRKEAEQVKSMVLTRGLLAFSSGICTLDDIRAQLHEDRRADTIPLFGKLKYEMTPEEIEKVNKISTNQQPSKGEDDERKDEEPAIRDEGA